MHVWGGRGGEKSQSLSSRVRSHQVIRKTAQSGGDAAERGRELSGTAREGHSFAANPQGVLAGEAHRSSDPCLVALRPLDSV